VSPAATTSTAGTITDEGIARLRARIGVAEPHPRPPHYRLPNEDTFRIVAQSHGDDNPLWCDPDHATASCWGGPIAPPALVGGDTLVGEDEVTDLDDETRALLKGDPLRGVHAFYAASAREWWAPLRPGRRVFRRNALVGALDKPSAFADRAVHEWTAQVFRDDEQVLAGQYRNMIRTERSKARDNAASRQDAVTISPWTPEALAEIDAAYAREQRRGPEPRFWEDVNEGDELPTLVKGPLTVTDMVCWHVGMGMGLYGVAPLRLGWQNRQRIPKFYGPDTLGVPDVAQRVHWDVEAARATGNPTTFDYGRMRETWLIHLCTDWMGDDAWLWRLDCELRRFNYVGDATWMGGRVIHKYRADGDRPAVDLKIWGRNQRDEVTAPGSATVLLPSRKSGAVRLPEPPAGRQASLQATLDAIAERFDRT
jgi:acyl dehydratase